MSELIKYLHRLLFEPAAYYCKPLLNEHKWRAPVKNEVYPVCVHCGKKCHWLYGYTLNSGTHLRTDNEAQKVMIVTDYIRSIHGL